jgi:anti-sigma factor RsiW
MQEALDDSLSLEARQELFQKLDQAPEEAEVYSRLKQVDRMLRTAPMERAPEKFALKVLARLAEGLQAQHLPRTAGMALALALALLALFMMPLLAAIGSLLLNALGDAGALSALLKSLSALLVTLMNGLQNLVTSAQQVVQEYPQTSAAVLALIPVGILWLARYMQGGRSSDET